MQSAVIPNETIVVTNCTSRKRGKLPAIVLDTTTEHACLHGVAKQWVAGIDAAHALIAAQDVYVGRSFSEAKEAARAVGGPLYVVSAGLGIVAGEENIPSYDLTVSPGDMSIAPLLRRFGQTPSAWWSALTAARGDNRSLQSLFQRHPKALVLIAVSDPYIDLLSADLNALNGDDGARLRIFTSSLGATGVPDHLRQCVLPYDERLEGSAHAGTRSDFAQRALRHFVHNLHGHLLPLDVARDQVAYAIQSWVKPSLPTRVKKTDSEITALLLQNWQRHSGQAGKLLRFLRDDAMVACEQSRFQALWKHVEQTLAQLDGHL